MRERVLLGCALSVLYPSLERSSFSRILEWGPFSLEGLRVPSCFSPVWPCMSNSKLGLSVSRQPHSPSFLWEEFFLYGGGCKWYLYESWHGIRRYLLAYTFWILGLQRERVCSRTVMVNIFWRWRVGWYNFVVFIGIGVDFGVLYVYICPPFYGHCLFYS